MDGLNNQWKAWVKANTENKSIQLVPEEIKMDREPEEINHLQSMICLSSERPRERLQRLGLRIYQLRRLLCDSPGTGDRVNR